MTEAGHLQIKWREADCNSDTSMSPLFLLVSFPRSSALSLLPISLICKVSLPFVMQMRRVGAGGTTSSPKHDKYLIRRNGNCQARLIVSHIIWREVANLDIAFDLSLSRSCLSQPAHTLICLLFFSLQSLRAPRLSAHLVQAESHSLNSLVVSHVQEKLCHWNLPFLCIYAWCPTPLCTQTFFFPFVLCIASYAILFFPVWGNTSHTEAA